MIYTNQSIKFDLFLLRLSLSTVTVRDGVLDDVETEFILKVANKIIIIVGLGN